MSDSAKLYGVIALVVIGVIVLVFSFKSSFMGGPARAGLEQGLAIKRANEAASARQGGGGGPMRPGTQPHTPTPGGTGTQ